MSTYIKAGLWTKKKTGYLGELDLDLLISQNTPVITLPVLFNKPINGTLYSINTDVDISINNSVLLGYQVGASTLGISNSVMIGPYVGIGATNAEHSIMIGSNYTGYNSTGSTYTVMIGDYAGHESYSCTNSVFLGANSGSGSGNNNNCNFIGYNSGSFSTNLLECNFIGNSAGQNSTGNNVNAFGSNAGHSNALNGQTIFSNSSLPSYINRSAAVAAITVVLGASVNSTYLYYNETTFGIEAIRL